MKGQTGHRQCIVCRTYDKKNNLIRLTMVDNEVIVDYKQTKQVRGAYICKNKDCLEKAKKTNVLNRVYKKKINSSAYEKIEEAICNMTK